MTSITFGKYYISHIPVPVPICLSLSISVELNQGTGHCNASLLHKSVHVRLGLKSKT